MSELSRFVNNLSQSAHKQGSYDRRVKAAKVLAAHYSIEPYEVILMFTLPELAEQSFSQRCEAVGLTEEEYLVITTQAGFSKFLQEYRKNLSQNIHVQSMEKLSRGISKTRKNADDQEEFTVETKIVDFNQRTSQQQVTVNNNQLNFYEQARARLAAPTAQPEQPESVLIPSPEESTK